MWKKIETADTRIRYLQPSLKANYFDTNFFKVCDSNIYCISFDILKAEIGWSIWIYLQLW